MKQIFLTILVALCALAGTANTAMATTKTYIFVGQQGNIQTEFTGYFYAEGSPSTHYASTPSEWTYGTTGSLSFTLANGITLTLASSTNQLAWLTAKGLAAQGQATLTVNGGNTNYIYHVRLFDADGNLIQLDANGRQVKQNGVAVGEYWNMNKTFTKTYPADDGLAFMKIEISYDTTIPITDAVISGINDSYVVSDAAIEPMPTVTWHGTTLTSGTHYTVSYQNNSAAGTATVKATGTGIFSTSTYASKNYTLAWATYTVRFHKNDGGDPEATSDQSFYYTEEKALAANAFSREDYVFSGWNTQADGNGTTYTNGQSVSNLSTTNGDVIDLYAQWRQVGGSCGDNAHWFYNDNGTLSITGSGTINNYNYDTSFYRGNRPWEQYKDYITTVSIGDGITSIGYSAFSQCSNLANITGGNDLINVASNAFYGTQWYNTAMNNDIVNYIGHVAYICGYGVSGDVTLAGGTIAIAENAFCYTAITSVTIPASVTSISSYAFYNCIVLATVNVLAATPPTLGDNAFYLNDFKNLARTFNVRSAAYKTASGWADIYNKASEYIEHNNFEMRVVSTLALPDGVAIVPEASASPVTILGTDYYAEQTTVTLSGLGTEYDAGGITYRSRATVTYGTDQTINADATGQATFTMPAADATVTAGDFPYAVKYIDATGTERSKPYADVTFIPSGSGQKLGSSANTEAWYAVLPGNVSAGGTLTFQDQSAHLILCDGATLTASSVNYGISIANGLTIYAQSGGTGSITARNSANDTYAISVGSGGLTINGGSVSATGDCGIRASISSVTINGGNVTATGSTYGISASNNVTINGGSVSATGSYGINAGSTITLGWTSATDRITASRYNRNPVVKSGQTLYDGTTAYSGTVDKSALANKTLMGVDILLDDDSAQPDGSKNADRIAALVDGKQHNVMLQGRTLYRDGNWNTLCLPFTVKLASDMNNVKNNEDHIFHGATVMRFNTNHWFDSAGDNYHEEAAGRHRSGQVDADGSLHLYFSKTMDVNDFWGDFSAGTPHIVKWGTMGSHPATHIVNPVFQGVTVTSTTPDFYTTEEGYDSQTGLGNVTMRGTFAPEPIYADPATNLYLGTNNTLHWPSTDGYTIGTFRAYFELGNGLTCGTPTSQVHSFILGFDDSAEETGISSLTPDPSPKGEGSEYYTLDGRKLNGKPTQKGLYIVNGRKVVIK